MKPACFLLPGVVLASGIAWLSTQAISISRLENENSELRASIAARASRPPGAESGNDSKASRKPSGNTAKKKDPIDWKSVAAQFGEMQRSGGMGDMPMIARMQQRIQSMTYDEIIAAIDEIGALGFSDQDRLMLEQMLVGPLALKDPKLALDHFISRIHEDNGIWGWQLSNALKGWSEKDLPAATAWFDQQIAAGVFESRSLDGRSHARQNFEGAFVATLLGSDPEAASRRLAGLPAEQRAEVLRHHGFSNLDEKGQIPFASLVRSQVPEKEQAETIAYPAANLASNGDYIDVTRYLDLISATPAEREAAVLKSGEAKLSRLSQGKKIGATEIDEMRVWAESQAPGSADKATGQALANMSNYNDINKFEDNAQLALHYKQSTGSDEVLVTFLDSWAARSNKDAARTLAEQISDEAQRAEALKKLK